MLKVWALIKVWATIQSFFLLCQAIISYMAGAADVNHGITQTPMGGGVASEQGLLPVAQGQAPCSFVPTQQMDPGPMPVEQVQQSGASSYSALDRQTPQPTTGVLPTTTAGVQGGASKSIQDYANKTFTPQQG